MFLPLFSLSNVCIFAFLDSLLGIYLSLPRENLISFNLLLLTKKPQASVPATSLTFVSRSSLDTGVISSYKLRKRVEVVRNCKNVGKKDMKYNDVMPKMKVDPEKFVSCLLLIRMI